MTTSQKNALRKLAKKEFSIPKATWINVFEIVTDSQYLVTYIDRIKHVEHRKMLTIN